VKGVAVIGVPDRRSPMRWLVPVYSYS